jgi:hypothetical protein
MTICYVSPDGSHVRGCEEHLGEHPYQWESARCEHDLGNRDMTPSEIWNEVWRNTLAAAKEQLAEEEEDDKKQTMREELLRKLAKLAGPQDEEIAHAEADHLLVEYIADPEIAAAYEAVEKWYA